MATQQGVPVAGLVDSASSGSLECAMATARVSTDRLQFSGHETFPLRQLWLRKAYFAVADGPDDGSVFTEESAIRHFGVGKNMVSAIRHWGLATHVLAEGKRGEVVTGPIGDLLFGRQGVDHYLERPATCWLVHWMLAGRASRSTTWHWVFNRVTTQTFDRDTLVKQLMALAAERRSRASESTLQRDVEVCIRCYLSRSGREVDDVVEPLLADLGLITEGPTGTFQFRRGSHPTLPDEVFAFALSEFWDRWEETTGSSQNTMSFEAIAHDFGSPGRVFKLDEASVAERLLNLDTTTAGALRWTDSAGLRQVSRPKGKLDEASKMRLLKKAYGR